MKIYNTPTQEDYDALMSELEVKGHKWLSGYKPSAHAKLLSKLDEYNKQNIEYWSKKK